MRISRFEGGVIYFSSSAGAVFLSAEVYARHFALGAEQGFLGLPIAFYEWTGAAQAEFEGGVICWSPASDAHEVHGAIRDHFNQLGSVGGWLGFPITDELDVLTETDEPTGGRLLRFQQGTIYCKSSDGAYEVHGGIRDCYEKMGGPLSYLGYPITDESSVEGTDIRYNDFENGILVGDRTWVVVHWIAVLHLGSVYQRENIDDGLDFPHHDHKANWSPTRRWKSTPTRWKTDRGDLLKRLGTPMTSTRITGLAGPP